MMSDHNQIVDKAARALGWFDYPSDSIECGDTWHTDRQKAPFDRIVLKSDFDPLNCWDDAMMLATHLMMSIHTGPIEASASTITTTLAMEFPKVSTLAMSSGAATRLAITMCAATHYEVARNDQP
ncbi:MAG: hypothetical protein ACRCXB_23295 [Aeromonadaceae bacterium]